MLKKIRCHFVGNSGSTLIIGGETGIRTLGARKGTTVFETAPIDHSGISPRDLDCKVSHSFLFCNQIFKAFQ